MWEAESPVIGGLAVGCFECYLCPPWWGSVGQLVLRRLGLFVACFSACRDGSRRSGAAMSARHEAVEEKRMKETNETRKSGARKKTRHPVAAKAKRIGDYFQRMACRP